MGTVVLEGDLNPIGWTVNGGNVSLDGVTISPGSPALTVRGGRVTLTGVTAYGGDSPTIVVTGGVLTLRHSTIQESYASAQPALAITGGTIDLGIGAEPGENIVNINGSGDFVRNPAGIPISAAGTTFTINGSPLVLSSLSGVVFADFNDDGEVDFGERGIPGVRITLNGTDMLGRPVVLGRPTDADGAYVFRNLFPGSYRIVETQPAGYKQGINSPGTAGGTASFDRFDVALGAAIDALNYNFGERPAAACAVGEGQTAGIGFWNNKNGQALIKSLNGGAGRTQLGDWLGATFPNMFGVNSGTSNLTGRSNADVAAFFQGRFVLKGEKLDAQVLATALAVYVTNATLNGTRAGTLYGFVIAGNGVGTATFDVGSNGEAFGVANGTVMTVMDLLLAVDLRSTNGVLYNGNTARRTRANNVFAAINQAGRI
ncbi:MAG: SdrD B-like domain-containing protein [Isosphaeraceae bacterium]